MSFSCGPTPRIWKKWSISHTLWKPTSSATRAICASFAPICAAPPGHVKLGICRPIFIRILLERSFRLGSLTADSQSPSDSDERAARAEVAHPAHGIAMHVQPHAHFEGYRYPPSPVLHRQLLD